MIRRVPPRSFPNRPLLPAFAIPRLSRTAPHSQMLTSVFSHPCALFCIHQKLNSFVFRRFHALCTKHPGGGYPSIAPPVTESYSNPFNLRHSSQAVSTPPQRLDLACINLHRHRPLDQIQRNHKPRPLLPLHQDALQARQRSRSHAYPSPKG
jgi:hypothetical protein